MSYPQDPNQQGAYPPQYQQPYQPAQQPAAGPKPAAASRRPLYLAAAAGFVVAAVIALVLSLTGVLPGSDDSDSPSTSSISLPGTVGSYVPLAKTRAAQSEGGKKSVQNATTSNARTAQALAAAHHGAGAAVQSYASSDLQTMFQIWAVRDESPRPVLAYQDADYLGLAEPQQVVKKYGNSYCQLFDTKATPKGQKPPGDSYIVSQCLRSDGDLTVAFIGGGGSDLVRNPTAVAKLVDEVWASIH